MQTTVKLQELFSYSIIPIIVVIIPIIGIITYLILTRKSKNVESVRNEPITNSKKQNFRNIGEIKNQYLQQLNIVENNYKNNKIELRQAYQKISGIIRLFIYEVTDIKTQNYSLSEIKKLNIPQLYDLIEEFYEPEFASKSEGDFNLSINKARRVIVEWK